MSLLTDNRMHKYVESATGRVVIMMNSADEVVVGERKFTRRDKVTEMPRTTVEVKPAVEVKPNKKV